MQPINYMTKTNQFRSKQRGKKDECARTQKHSHTLRKSDWIYWLNRKPQQNDICKDKHHTNTEPTMPVRHSHPQIFWLVQNWNEIIAYNKITAINVIMNHRTSHAILWYMMKVQDAVVLRAFIIISRVFFARSMPMPLLVLLFSA